MHRGNVDYVIVVVIFLLPLLLFHIVPISFVAVIITAFVVVIIRFPV